MMKNAIKVAAIIICVLMISTMLTGCKWLDELKENRAYWNNQNRNEVILKGKIYKKLKASDYFSPEMNRGYKSYITNKDEPILLAGTGFSNCLLYDITEDKELILTNGVYYARSDVYDKYVELNKSYTLSNLASFKPSTDKDDNYCIKTEILSDEEAETVKNAIASRITDELPKTENELYTEIISCDSNLLFQKFETVFLYFASENKIFYEMEDKTFVVEDEYKDQILEIMKKYHF